MSGRQNRSPFGPAPRTPNRRPRPSKPLTKNQKIFVGVFAVLFITGTIVGIYYAVKDMKEDDKKK